MHYAQREDEELGILDALGKNGEWRKQKMVEMIKGGKGGKWGEFGINEIT